MRHSLLTCSIAVLGIGSATLAQSGLDYSPSADAVIDTDGATLVATNGTVVRVNDGIFRFRNVTIPVGVTIRATGSRPMIWIVEQMTVDGALDASGEDGQRVNTLNSANFPSRGGRGGPAGGRGGAGSPQLGMRSFAGMAGHGPTDLPGMGGTGGLLGLALNGPGSGGAGGAFATAGDPHYKQLAPGGTSTSFVQQLGFGGYGGSGASGSPSRTLIGGGPGGTPFFDGDDENDFYGLAFDVHRNRVVQGELGAFLGGSGGGGGGDRAVSRVPFDPLFVNDNKGGGGGGGGGFLAVVASQRIVVGPSGRVRCNGGHGGGGEPAGSCEQGGGGGGGSGGVLILASFGQIQLHVKGETYANNDYDFVLAADGGVCRTSTLLSPNIQQKYALTGTTGPVVAASQYDARPLGGFGGMGIVELVVPAGSNGDGTNTVLDDNIEIVRGGLPLSGATKQRYLAWRGWRNASGVRVDDSGTPVIIGGNEGDIRPAPILVRL